MVRFLVAAFGVMLFATIPISAQEGAGTDRPLSPAELVGDVTRGRQLAETMCGSCHEVRPAVQSAAGASPPSFTTIADMPGITELALTVWLTTFHPERTMPAITMNKTERQDLIAYILWLGENS